MLHGKFRPRTTPSPDDFARGTWLDGLVALLLSRIAQPMKYALTLSAVPAVNGPSLLEDGHTRASIASQCRSAALDFMAGVADGWSKFDLALWLRGPYALAARHSQHGDRIQPPPGRDRAIDEGTIESLLVGVRGYILAHLEKAVLDGGTLDLIEDALLARHVTRAIDDCGEYTWVPVDGARMRLRDRVASLFVADYLNGPHDYKDLYVCHHCEAVVFEEGAKERGMCSAHHRISAVVPKESPLSLLRAKSPKRTLGYYGD